MNVGCGRAGIVIDLSLSCQILAGFAEEFGGSQLERVAAVLLEGMRAVSAGAKVQCFRGFCSSQRYSLSSALSLGKSGAASGAGTQKGDAQLSWLRMESDQRRSRVAIAS